MRHCDTLAVLLQIGARYLSWIGWLLDLPGVNAQEKTRDAVVASLQIGAEDMLTTQAPFEPGSTMVLIDRPDPNWIGVS